MTSGENVLHAKYTPMKSFSSQDVVVLLIGLQWDATQRSLGKHSLTWNWYSGNKLISTDTKTAELHNPPYKIWSRREAFSLGTGSFRAEVLLDGHFLAGNTFTIHS